MNLDDVPVDDFVPSIVVPLIRALGDHGLHANLESSTNHIYQNEGTLAYALFPGGELSFVYTTGPTHNVASGTVDTSRYMMATINGVPRNLGITEEGVNSALRQFETGLWEREIYGARSRVTEGKSLGGKVKTETFSLSPDKPQSGKDGADIPRIASAPPSDLPDSRRTSGSHETPATLEYTEPGTSAHAPIDSADSTAAKKGGCYIATAVYGGYDMPQVRVLRRFRDDNLATNRAGRGAIRCYYKLSPILVHHLGRQAWFQRLTRPMLDVIVSRLRSTGISDTAYDDSELSR